MVSEVKGAWFVAARAWLEARGSLEATARALRPDVRQVLLEPIPAAWYPETTLQASMQALRDQVAPERAQFVAAMDACTEVGTSRFFRALLRMASPQFVLRQVPTMWRHIRKGDARIHVETEERRAVVHYASFPWFADENYRLLTEGALRALVRTCTGSTPKVTILRASDDALDVEVLFRPTVEPPGKSRPPLA